MIELAKELRLKPVFALGHLHALWHAALEQQEDGDLSSWSDDLIAEMSAFDGSAPQYVSLLQQHQWLDGKILHDWLDYAGGYLRSKYHHTNRRWLINTWLKHGKRYGKSTSLRKGKGPPGLSKVRLSKVLNSFSSEESLRETNLALPNWLDAEVWNSYCQHRAAMPKKNHMSANAEKLAIAQLAKWWGAGHDPNEIVRTSIMNGWLGLFEPKAAAAQPRQFNDEANQRIQRALRRGL